MEVIKKGERRRMGEGGGDAECARARFRVLSPPQLSGVGSGSFTAFGSSEPRVGERN